MPLPHYQQDAQLDLKAALKDKAANRGLLFERFFPYPDIVTCDLSGQQHAKAKSQFIDKCVETPLLMGEQIKRYNTRQLELIAKLGGKAGIFKTDWNWVTGMGNNHPTENGFSWHHSLSTPYLPGSSVKGMLRAWFECYQDEIEQEKVLQWFGNKRGDKNEKPETAPNLPKEHAGDIVFFDALPVYGSQPKMIRDIMTPHTGDWLAEGHKGQTAPADWHTPTPISFLAAKNVELLFSFAPRNKHISGDDLAILNKGLEDALGFLGAGAKTAVGYGTMERRCDKEARLLGILNLEDCQPVSRLKDIKEALKSTQDTR